VKLLLMWLVGVPALVATMVMASRVPAHASIPAERQARVSFESCAQPAAATAGLRQLCRTML
jgi:hypothetical protein